MSWQCRALGALLLTVVTLAQTAPAHAAQAGGSEPANEIRALEEALARAMHARDRAAAERLLAPGYILRSVPDIDRETWLQNAMMLCWGDRSNIDRFTTRAQRDVVVASFELTFFVDPNTCRAAVLRSLITDVWMRGPDGWQLHVRHSGPAPAPGAGVAAQFGVVPLPPPRWAIGGELSLVATSGNTSTRTIGLGGSVTHRTDASTTRGVVSFVTSELEGETQARSITAQGRHGVRLGGRMEAFGQGSYARDRFAGIENRGVAEGGVAYTTPLPQPHALILEGGVGYTVEARLDTTELRFVTTTGAVRYRWRIRPGAELTEDVHLIADVETAPNWRGTSATVLTVTLNQLLSLRASHLIEYRNTPVAGFGRTDTRTAAALVFSYERRP